MENKQSVSRKMQPILLALFVLLSLWMFTPSKIFASDLKVNYIDVGQGNATLIENNGTNTLIDTGTESNYSKLKSFLDQEKVSTIHNFVVTHPDADHMGGADLVIEQYKVNNFYTTNYASTTNEYKEMINALAKANIPIQYVDKGDGIGTGSNATCKVLSPVNGTKYYDSNSASVVMMLTYHNKKFLFTGDIPAAVESKVASANSVNTDVLQVAHHGSSGSSGVSFLKACSPDYAIISVGADNSYGHPTTTVLDRLAVYAKNTLRTDLNGSITCATNGSSLKVSTSKAQGGSGTCRINKAVANLYVDQWTPLSITGATSKVTWSSTNSSVAYVASNGKVTAKKAGTATIIGRTSGFSYACRVTVKNKYLSKTKLTMTKGYAYTLRLTGGIGTSKWKTSNKNYATVTSKGKITAKKAGTVYIRVKNGTKILSCKVTIHNKKLKKIMGNKRSKIYHTTDCGHLPTKKNRKYFTSEKKAKKAHYRKCKNCK